MEIFITNDDGWGAKGILTIVRIMSKLGHVTVVAPDGARSGMSNAITVAQPIYLRQLNDPSWGAEEWQKNVTVYTTNGTPSDCVKLAIDVVCEGDSSKVDLLVSGINHGSNAGINVIYSGTMGACFVGAEHGIPSIGFSIDDHRCRSCRRGRSSRILLRPASAPRRHFLSPQGSSRTRKEQPLLLSDCRY